MYQRYALVFWMHKKNCDGYWNCGGMYRIFALVFWIHKQTMMGHSGTMIGCIRSMCGCYCMVLFDTYFIKTENDSEYNFISYVKLYSILVTVIISIYYRGFK